MRKKPVIDRIVAVSMSSVVKKKMEAVINNAPIIRAGTEIILFNVIVLWLTSNS
jgi:hypothetical protein